MQKLKQAGSEILDCAKCRAGRARKRLDQANHKASEAFKRRGSSEPDQ